MATTIEGQSIYVGQIVKKVTVPNADIPATGLNKIIGPVFEMNHKDKVTVAIRVVSGPDISNVQLMRVFSDGVASEESISAGGFAADDGPTFAVTYNVPKFRIDYEIASSTGVDSVVLIEVEGGVGA
jgi:hypothetical protein